MESEVKPFAMGSSDDDPLSSRDQASAVLTFGGEEIGESGARSFATTRAPLALEEHQGSCCRGDPSEQQAGL